MMAALALVDAGAIFAAVCAAALAGWWSFPGGPSGIATVLSTAMALSLLGVGALYFHDAYDPRVVRSFGRFASRLPRSLLTIAVPLALLDVVVPASRMPGIITVLAMAAVVPPLRALCYAVMKS